MCVDEVGVGVAVLSQDQQPEEVVMVRREVWGEIRRAARDEGLSTSALARRFQVDRKTVRHCLSQEGWRPYRRPERTDTLMVEHKAFVEARAPEVGYSARVLYQELCRERGFAGSYDTVKRFVAPLRAVRLQADRALTRFETPPGLQTQIDWGQARVPFRRGAVVVHLFVFTLGFSRRSFYRGYPDERIGQFLEGHEQAFEHFGGHTREHLYDRPRTVCRPDGSGRAVWNPTFKAFADYWGFEPRLCAPYRAQTKGKVESGVKYVKRNFLSGREFLDWCHFDEELVEWNATVADVRIHGTTHERPIDRFEGERPRLQPLCGQPSFKLQVRSSRVVAEDYLVSYQTNRYSVPYTLIGQSVEVECRGDELLVYHRDQVVATHAVLGGRHQLAILPEHGPGAIARNQRLRRGHRSGQHSSSVGLTDVEIRDLTVYEQLATGREVCP